jgi:Homing endonuclease associated repeat
MRKRTVTVTRSKWKGRRWKQQEIIAAMRSWATANGRAPKCGDWNSAGFDYPSSSTVLRHFSTWNSAVREADLTNGRERPPRRWNRQAVLKALQRWTEEEGRVPKERDWDHATEEHPNFTTVVYYCGGWHQGLVLSGLVPDEPESGQWTDSRSLPC